MRSKSRPVLALGILLSSAFLALTVFGVDLAGATDNAKAKAKEFQQLTKELDGLKYDDAVGRTRILQSLAALKFDPATEFLIEKVRTARREESTASVVIGAFGQHPTLRGVQFLVTESFGLVDPIEWKSIYRQIGEIEHEDAREWFLEKGYRQIAALPPEPQGRMAEVLTFIADERAVEAAKKAVGNKAYSARAQVQFVRTLRNAGDDSKMKKIAKLYRLGDPELQQEVLLAIRDLKDEKRGSLLFKALADRDSAVVITGIDVLGDSGNPEFLKKVLPMLEERDPEILISAIHAVRKLGGKDAVDGLVELLGRAEGRVKDDCLDALIWLTGEDVGETGEIWKRWWEKNRETAKVGGISQEEFEALLKKDSGGQTGRYYGLRVLANEICFVMDISGSMESSYALEGATEEELKGAKTRLDVAKKELESVVYSLKDGVMINMIRFDTLVVPWNTTLTELDDETRALAVKWIRSTATRGGETNIYESLTLALSDPQVTTIYFLSDGAPTAGAITDGPKILEEINEINRVRKVKIHTIGFRLEKEARDLLKQLAEQNGGTFIEK